LKIVTKIGTIHEGFLQYWGDGSITLADKVCTLISLKDIAVIEKSPSIEEAADLMEEANKDLIEAAFKEGGCCYEESDTSGPEPSGNITLDYHPQITKLADQGMKQ